MTAARVLPYRRAICYSGFRDGQSPDVGRFPSKREIAEDLKLLAPYWDAIRLYACDLHAARVLEVIDAMQLPFKVMLGAYIGAEVSNPNCPWGGEHADVVLRANKVANEQEIGRLIDWANRYAHIVDVVSAGNEATVDWTDHLVEPSSVVRYVQFIKASVLQPVTFCENYVPWTDQLEDLAAAVDVIAIHSYPVWESKSLEEAMAYTQANYSAVQEAYPDKQVIITEAGWTTASNGRGIDPGHVNENTQNRYLQALQAWAEQRQILVYVFEAFDENWKGSDHPLEPEKHWGIYRSDRTPKLAAQRG